MLYHYSYMIIIYLYDCTETYNVDINFLISDLQLKFDPK